MRTALAISFVVHAFGALGISRIGGLVFGQSDAMAMAVSIELVEQLPDTPPSMDTSLPRSGAPDEPAARTFPPRPPRPASTHRSGRARRPPSESPPQPSDEAPFPTRTEAAAPPPVPVNGQTGVAAAGLAIPAGSENIHEAHGTGPSKATAPPAESPRRTPNWERISQVVRQHVVYPTLARRRGFHGQATVAFLVTPGGMVDQLRVIESSGHDLLDTAALDAVSRSAPLPISTEPTRIVIPIVFSLQ